ncbi:hypothetical protein ACFQ8X_20755, partial [Embleya sp. NPDC056538]
MPTVHRLSPGTSGDQRRHVTWLYRKDPVSTGGHGASDREAGAPRARIRVGPGTMGLIMQQLLQRAGANVTVVD